MGDGDVGRPVESHPERTGNASHTQETHHTHSMYENNENVRKNALKEFNERLNKIFLNPVLFYSHTNTKYTFFIFQTILISKTLIHLCYIYNIYYVKTYIGLL